MDKDEFFDMLNEQFEEMAGAEAREKFQVINDRWLKIGELVSGLGLSGLSGDGGDWFEAELNELGINVKALLMMGMRLAIAKNEPPMDFTARFVSGYMLGYVSALEERGEQVIDDMLSRQPPVEEYDGPMMNIGVLKVETKPLDEDMELDLDALAEHMRSAAEGVGESFEDPDDDWSPVLVVVSDTEVSMISFEIPDEGAKKDLFGHVIPDAVKRVLPETQRCAFVVSAWTLDTGEDEAKAQEHKDWLQNRRPGEQIRDHPDHVETLMLYAMDRDGDSEFWLARIQRDGEHPPTLEEWTPIEVGRMEGRVTKMLKRILS